MLGSVFQVHQQVIRRVDSMICYVGLTGSCAASPLLHRAAGETNLLSVCVCVCVCDRLFQSPDSSLETLNGEINLQSSMKHIIFFVRMCVAYKS